ncbi:MAG TPA: hypothetical protein VFP65_08335 [Anaeromyxobacteraceae bacterium]|nr:hypothetical protein [Anaeromyxobacteraceae bacterium]
MSRAHPNPDRETHLTHRSAGLSLVAALFFFVGLVTFGVTIQKTEDIAVRAVSGAPLGVAIGSAVWAGVTRSRLRALREGVPAAEGSAGDPAVREPDGSPAAEDRPSAAPEKRRQA